MHEGARQDGLGNKDGALKPTQDETILSLDARQWRAQFVQQNVSQRDL